jgi:hypothetical protein
MEGRRKSNRVRFEGEMRYAGHRIEQRDSNNDGWNTIVFTLTPAD